MCLALLYAAVPSACADASGQLAAMICYTLVYSFACRVYSFACRVCVATLGRLARYEALKYAAAGCAYVASPNEIT